MGKEDLELIFNPLPFCCMILLGSIGSAGLIRNENFQVMDAKKKTISPSGLLDIIAGVTSQEESVLIVTTNKPEQLYEALLRPGRIGSQIEFRKPRIAEIKQLFQLIMMFESQLTWTAEQQPRSDATRLEECVKKSIRKAPRSYLVL
ncbi:hypothetical protein BGAL_0471g00090 [Botrytis galanthina]|uniref:ATPase AAA-type core domain-containing protein n=1 Tax=Botrytis galanthina TaxID=278940 RepID=A0A4S8QVM6_9HELO|nr:hypothetical protein BGAL_0471g00090 [Botrytis galanthina]